MEALATPVDLDAIEDLDPGTRVYISS